ncbi:histidine utilization repressor [Aliiglaciecola sp. M165]|uniref:histidine utilization repressor n=1 Tax=Aliiglaciecola sp. M165 TaxID=2593649 RepID=UPI0011816371|nr:histidine utilization repressor [Aliiglaciecola sp. M165]TRY29884.1 histidine utilization repressor [Aliiglaciecola sp. M165]
MQARYIAIKSAILDKIESGDMSPNQQVPSENQLALQFNVSRMTARRALTELVDEGILMRSQGLGTYVSDHRPMSSMLEIRSIHDEIIHRGHHYNNQVLCQQRIVASPQQSTQLGVAAQAEIFHTRIVHLEAGFPIQLEDRIVNPRWAPEYLAQDFNQITANQYLSQVAPLTQADHIVEAVLPEQQVADTLQIQISDPCLVIARRTFSAKGIVSFARLFHPGHRYRIGGHLEFTPKG